MLPSPLVSEKIASGIEGVRLRGRYLSVLPLGCIMRTYVRVPVKEPKRGQTKKKKKRNDIIIAAFPSPPGTGGELTAHRFIEQPVVLIFG